MALHRQVNLDHLQHARRQVVARGDLVALLVETPLEFLALCPKPLGGTLELQIEFVILDPDFEPAIPGQIGQVGCGDFAT